MHNLFSEVNMNKNNQSRVVKIKQSEHILTIKLKTEGNGLGVLKTLIVILLIAAQFAVLALSYFYFAGLFSSYLTFSIVATLITCIYVLSSDYHGQAKATWILFLLLSFGFGYIIFLLSDKKISFGRSQKKYKNIFNQTEKLKNQTDNISHMPEEIKTSCNYLYNVAKFPASTQTKSTYFPSGTSLFDSIIEDLEKAKSFIFIEFFIISNGKLLNKILKILQEKAAAGVMIKIIYDDMGSHGTLKRKTKKQIKKAGIELQEFNRLLPVFNIALNLRDHRKIVIIDGKIAYTGGTNLADEYVNEKRMHGYWKDEGIKIEGPAVDNLTLAFLEQWKFLTHQDLDFSTFLNRAEKFETNGVVVPFVSGPNYQFSIAQNIYASEISNAKEKLYIMTPYFVPDETITNLIINKARSGVDVRIVLPDVADKKFVYIVSRNNAEKLIASGVKLYTMTHSFVHSKVIFTENSCIVGSINMDLRSFNQQFESAVFTNQKQTMKQVLDDFEYAFSRSTQITSQNMNRRSRSFRALAGLFNIISPFM